MRSKALEDILRKSNHNSSVVLCCPKNSKEVRAADTDNCTNLRRSSRGICPPELIVGVGETPAPTVAGTTVSQKCVAGAAAAGPTSTTRARRAPDSSALIPKYSVGSYVETSWGGDKIHGYVTDISIKKGKLHGYTIRFPIGAYANMSEEEETFMVPGDVFSIQPVGANSSKPPNHFNLQCDSDFFIAELFSKGRPVLQLKSHAQPIEDDHVQEDVQGQSPI